MSIKVQSLQKSFLESGCIFSDLNLEIEDNAFVTILGPSGCGKSTLLRCLAGLEPYDQGEITFNNNIGKDGQIAFVFQQPMLLGWRSIQDNVRLPLELKKTIVTDDDIKKTLELTGLYNDRHLYPSQCSGGMQMRVSIARALITNPLTMYMDEPFAALDELTREYLQQQLLEVWIKKKCTILFITHNIFEAVYLSQKVYVMSDRPSKVIGEVAIDEPYPRSDDFRSSSNFFHYVKSLQQCLKGAKDV